MATAEYTPQPEHISPPDSITPTRHASQSSHPLPRPPPMPDFTSPSAYINTDAYTPGDGSYTDSMYEASSAHSSLSIAQSAVMLDFTYPGFEDFAPDTDADPSSRVEDDRTPVVSEHQQQIHPRSFPAPPHVSLKADKQQGTSAPFRAYPDPAGGHPGMSYHPHHPQHVASHMSRPTAAPMYYAPAGSHAPPQAMMYHHHPGHELAQYPQYINVHPQMTGHMYPQVGGYYPHPHAMMPAQQYDFGPTKSRNGSPTSSISSSAISLTRTGSMSSDIRQPRPKVKLTWEDKRDIVELHRANSSLRQEDIARQYGVDRSTISKIILSSHRWTQPQEVQVAPVPKPAKSVGGRFPAIEAKMDQWMDEQIAAGMDVRDNVARDKAKDFAREIGFPIERFKASAKWLDKFKDRRKAAGKLTSSPSVGYYMPYTQAPYDMSQLGSHGLSRSQSTATLSSSDSSSAELYQPSPSHLAPTPELVTPTHLSLTRSETDLSIVGATPSSRRRSQSSPHLLGEPGNMSPSSGKASRFSMRPSPLNLQRQNSYHGSSPSPRRPVALTRSNTSQGGNSLRRSRPTSLAASAFGITPINGDDQFSASPVVSPVSSTAGTHSRQPSDASLVPFTSSLGGMTISPTISDNGAVGGAPPLTPITPGYAVDGGVFSAGAYCDMPNEFGMPMNYVQGGHPGQYASMPNKHYYLVPQAPPQQATTWQ